MNEPDMPQESSGLHAENMPHSQEEVGTPTQPLSEAWIGSGLLERTRDVWGKSLGRRVQDKEAAEIILNFKDFLMAIRDELERRRS